MIMKLTSMTDFVLEFENNFPRQFGEAYSEYNESKSEYLNMKLKSYENYAQFLKQPLTLEMFVPCNLDGNVLEEPKFSEFVGYTDKFYELNKQYQQAKDRVLFKIINPRLINKNLFLYESYIYYSEGLIYENNDGRSLELIQDLISFTDLTLTQTAIKQIGL